MKLKLLRARLRAWVRMRKTLVCAVLESSEGVVMALLIQGAVQVQVQIQAWAQMATGKGEILGQAC